MQFYILEKKKKMSINRSVRTSGAGATKTDGGTPVFEKLTLLRDRLLDLDIPRAEFFETEVPEAADFALGNPYAFLLASCLDRGSPSRLIWTIPWWLRQDLGHLDPARISSLSLAEIEALVDRLPRKPRYAHDTPRTLRELTQMVVGDFHGDAAAVWRGRSARDFQRSLERIRGVGPNISSMTVQLVERVFPGELAGGDEQQRNIKVDVHTRRVLHRLGVAPDDSDEAARQAARRLNPDQPGLVDAPLWYIGHKWCRPTAPLCDQCPVCDLCASAR
jgi:endonuclease III